MSLVIGYRPDMRPNYKEADIAEYQQMAEMIRESEIIVRYDAAKECLLDAAEELHKAIEWLQDAANNLNGLSHEGETFDFMNKIGELVEPIEKLARTVGKEIE